MAFLHGHHLRYFHEIAKEGSLTSTAAFSNELLQEMIQSQKAKPKS